MKFAEIGGIVDSARQKGMIIMEFLPSGMEPTTDKSVKTQCLITINAGNGQGKIYLSCNSWGIGTALLAQVMTQLDLIGSGLKT